jgi:hypothetical protein
MVALKQLFLTIIFFLSLISQSFCQSQERIYALFMVNFARGIDWPQQADKKEFTIDVLSYAPLAAELEQLAATTKIHGKSLKVRRIEDVVEAKADIIFVPSFKYKVLPALSSNTALKPSLIISNSPGATQKGASINFFLQNGKQSYEINLKTITQKSLKVGTNVKSSGVVVDGSL